MVLGYYKGDYRCQSSWLNGSASPASEPNANRSLFNGDIAFWSSKSLGVATQAAAPPSRPSTSATTNGSDYMLVQSVY
jgi:hypothetical protein